MKGWKDIQLINSVPDSEYVLAIKTKQVEGKTRVLQEQFDKADWVKNWVAAQPHWSPATYFKIIKIE